MQQLEFDYYLISMALAQYRAGRHNLPSTSTAYCRSGDEIPFFGAHQLCQDLVKFGRLSAGLLDNPNVRRLFRSQKEEDWFSSLDLFFSDMQFSWIPEGSVVRPNFPLFHSEGPLALNVLLETYVAHFFNEALGAAARARKCVKAATGVPVVDFSCRRRGSDLVSLGAYIGGCTSTSNVNASVKYGIPLAGTQAHSWPLSWGKDTDAIEAWDQHGNNKPVCFIADTFSLNYFIQSLKAFISVYKSRDYQFTIRLDSQHEAASEVIDQFKDFPGFRGIFFSGNLDPDSIRHLRREVVKLAGFGVGTYISVGSTEPGCVFKLVEVDGQPVGKADLPGKTSLRGKMIPIPGGTEKTLVVRDDYKLPIHSELEMSDHPPCFWETTRNRSLEQVSAFPPAEVVCLP